MEQMIAFFGKELMQDVKHPINPKTGPATGNVSAKVR
jgi:hypothetical protein